MSLRSWWRDLLGEDRPPTPPLISQEQAIEAIHAYAAEHGYPVKRPIYLELGRERRDEKHPEVGFRYVHRFALGTDRPMPFVDVDAEQGNVLSWRTLPY